MSQMVKCIKWPNGTIQYGDTWEELEQSVMSRQWDEYESVDDFRADMKRRALIWSGEIIDDFGSSRDFLGELERAMMLLCFEIPNNQPRPTKGRPFDLKGWRDKAYDLNDDQLDEDSFLELTVPVIRRPLVLAPKPAPKPQKKTANNPWMD